VRHLEEDGRAAAEERDERRVADGRMTLSGWK